MQMEVAGRRFTRSKWAAGIPLAFHWRTRFIFTIFGKTRRSSRSRRPSLIVIHFWTSFCGRLRTRAIDPIFRERVRTIYSRDGHRFEAGLPLFLVRKPRFKYQTAGETTPNKRTEHFTPCAAAVANAHNFFVPSRRKLLQHFYVPYCQVPDIADHPAQDFGQEKIWPTSATRLLWGSGDP